MWSLFFGGFGGDEEEEGGGGLVGGMLMLIVAPIAALLIQLAISRSREFSADAGGARILGDALPLIQALEKLERQSLNREPLNINPATSHLYIVNPLHGGGLASLFRTHPPTQERIARLQAMNRLELATA
jgi:heat shock protein HtpX